MLITEKLSISNTKRFFPNQKLFEVLYYAFLKEINFCERRGKRLFDNHKDQMTYSLREAGRTKFTGCRIIMLFNIIFDFMDWKPYVKTFNYVLIARFIIKKCRAEWDQFRYTRKKTIFDTNDHKIRVLYGLWEKGLYFQDYEHTPKAIKKLMSLELYGRYFLQKLFDRDFREGKMQYFSTSKKEGEPYYQRYYYRHGEVIDSHDDIHITEEDYNTVFPPQEEYAYFNINVDITGASGIVNTSDTSATTSGSTNYEQYEPTSGDSNTMYYNGTTGGTVTWNITRDS